MPAHLQPAPLAVTPAWRCLTGGIPLSLLLDLAAGEQLDSAAVLHDEAVAVLAEAALSMIEVSSPHKNRGLWHNDHEWGGAEALA